MWYNWISECSKNLLTRSLAFFRDTEAIAYMFDMSCMLYREFNYRCDSLEISSQRSINLKLKKLPNEIASPATWSICCN